VKAQFKVSPTLTIEIDAAKQKDLFKALASVQESFGERECGLCRGPVIPIWRKASKQVGKKIEEYEYPEWKCTKCPGRKSMGTINDDTGTLFPINKMSPTTGMPLSKKEKDAGVEGVWSQTNGYYKWSPQKENDE